MIDKILVRLPVKSLIRFKCVCKKCSRHDRLTLWNPATAKFRRLKPKLRFQRDFPRSNVTGFGWDPLREDYKLVWCLFWPSAHFDLAAVALYRHGNESWRQIDNPDVLYSQKVSWAGICFGRYLHPIISKLHLGTQYFSANDDDSIALLQNEYVPPTTTTLKLKFIHIWVMRQEDCWTKQFTLECENMVQIQHPLGFWKNSTELFIETADNELALCDLDTHRIQYLGVCGRVPENSNFLQVFKYKETVVSVKEGQRENWKRAKLHDIIWDFQYFVCR
ncbi:hypothetical protein LguiB_031456 [Lonicera macranthoides]